MKLSEIRNEVIRLQNDHGYRPPKVNELLAPYTDRAVVLHLKRGMKGVPDIDAFIEIPDDKAREIIRQIREIYARLPR